MTELLRARGIDKAFGGLQALSSVDVTVHAGEPFAIIGPNGAGKTTLLNILTGLDTPDGGEIFFEGESMRGAQPWSNASVGLARTLQTAVVFPGMTVRQNLVLGHAARSNVSFWGAMLRLPTVRRWTEAAESKAQDVAARLGIADHLDRRGDELPLGLQRLVEIGRALVTEPKLLVLDEPAAGLAKPEVDTLADVLEAVAEQSIGICLVEHNMRLVMRVASRIQVLQFGRTIAEGTPAEVRASPVVVDAYLGSTAGRRTG